LLLVEVVARRHSGRRELPGVLGNPARWQTWVEVEEI